jgi:hypothetical protein
MSGLADLPLRDDLRPEFTPVETEFLGDTVRVKFPNGREDVIPDWQYAAWFTKATP